MLRWGIGFLCLLPTAVILRVRWPERKDWLAVVALGLCFFGLFFVLYNIAVSYTTAARASLALSTLPLQTMIVGRVTGDRATNPTKNDRCLHRDLWGLCCAGVWPVYGSVGGLARRAYYDRRGLVHGVLQRLVPPVHSEIKCPRFSHSRHGGRGGRACHARPGDCEGRRSYEL